MLMAHEPVEPLTAPGLTRPSHSARGRWAIVALLMTLVGISHFNRISMPIAGDELIMTRYEIEPTRMGVVYSAFLVTYTLCMIPGGWFIDRFGAKRALMTVGFGSAVFVALTGSVGLVFRDAGSLFIALLVIRGLMGVVSAPLHPASARMVAHWFGLGGRSQANGFVAGAALVGIAATPPIFGALIVRFNWTGAFLIAGASTAVVGGLWAFGATERPRAAGPVVLTAPSVVSSGFARGWTGLLRDRSLVLLTLSYAAVGYFQYLFFYWMNYYFRNVLGLPDRVHQFYAAIPPLAMAVGMPLGGWLSDRLEREFGPRQGRRLVPIAGMFAGAALLVLGILARNPAWIVTWFSLALGAVGTAEGPFWATAIELGGRRGGSSAALFNTGGNLGGLMAPIITPWIGQTYGWPAAVAIGSLVCLAGCVLWFGVDVRGRMDDTPEPPASRPESQVQAASP